MTVQLMQRVKEEDADPGVAPRRVVFVTGGMGGIGTAICRRLGRHGSHGRRGLPARIRPQGRVAHDMRKEGFKAHAAEGDVSEFESCAEMFYNVRAVVGPIDILVNNAASRAIRSSSA
jgi:acetoacetyl-CoA reductase